MREWVFFDVQVSKAGVQSYTYVKNETDFTAELNGNQRHRILSLGMVVCKK